ncbi:hypothetical protein D3C86_1788410 [compost metagenome]
MTASGPFAIHRQGWQSNRGGPGLPDPQGRSALTEPDPVTERVMDFQNLAPALLDNIRTSIAIAFG